MFGLTSKKKLKELQADLDVAEYLLDAKEAENEFVRNELDILNGRILQLKSLINKIAISDTARLLEENELARIEVDMLNDIIDNIELNNL